MEGAELRARRMRLGISTRTLANIIGMDAKKLGAIEAGTRHMGERLEGAILDIWDDFMDKADQMEQSVLQILATDVPEALSDEIPPLRFYCYATHDEFQNAGGFDRYGVGWNMHSALVAEVAFRFERMGYPVEIDTFKGEAGEPSNDPTSPPASA